MDCTEARNQLLDRRRGTLAPELRAQVDAHLAECEACRQEDAADAELSVALETRLPKRRAPESLRRALGERMGEEASPPARSSEVETSRRARGERRAWPVVVIAAAAVFAAAAAFLLWKPPHGPDAMVTEAVNDHLRVLYSAHPLEIESGGVHQVKPWFEGRVDFAPTIAFGGDEDFPLEGGAIAYFVDRKAAAYVFKRRLHVITLFVYRADGLAWPSAPNVALGRARATEETARGFHVLLWREGDLGYALVSDLDVKELETLGGRIVGG